MFDEVQIASMLESIYQNLLLIDKRLSFLEHAQWGHTRLCQGCGQRVPDRPGIYNHVCPTKPEDRVKQFVEYQPLPPDVIPARDLVNSVSPLTADDEQRGWEHGEPEYTVGQG